MVEGFINTVKWIKREPLWTSRISITSASCPAAPCFQSNTSRRRNTGCLISCSYLERRGWPFATHLLFRSRELVCGKRSVTSIHSSILLKGIESRERFKRESRGVRCSGGKIDCDAEGIEDVRLLEPTRTLDDPGGLRQSDWTASESE